MYGDYIKDVFNIPFLCVRGVCGGSRTVSSLVRNILPIKLLRCIRKHRCKIENTPSKYYNSIKFLRSGNNFTIEGGIYLLELQSAIEGREAHFGYMRDKIGGHGFCIGGNWEYHKGSFDVILWRDSGETIYLRVPFNVTEGELDAYDTRIRFTAPFIIKHITHVGLEYDGSSLLDATGMSQFQTPIDKDAEIHRKNRWVQMGEQVVTDVVLPFVE